MAVRRSRLDAAAAGRASVDWRAIGTRAGRASQHPSGQAAAKEESFSFALYSERTPIPGTPYLVHPSLKLII